MFTVVLDEEDMPLSLGCTVVLEVTEDGSAGFTVVVVEAVWAKAGSMAPVMAMARTRRIVGLVMGDSFLSVSGGSFVSWSLGTSAGKRVAAP